MSELRIRQGEGFRIGFGFTDEAGTALDLTGRTVTVAVQDARGNVVTTLVASFDAPFLRWEAYATDTSAWPIGHVFVSFRLLDGFGNVEKSRPFSVLVGR